MSSILRRAKALRTSAFTSTSTTVWRGAYRGFAIASSRVDTNLRPPAAPADPESFTTNGGRLAGQETKPTETNRLEKTLQRFWEKVAVAEDQNALYQGYGIQLDGKPMKTPGGHKLIVPREKKTLAELIAHEWRLLPDLKIKNFAVPLTSVTARGIDLLHNEMEEQQKGVAAEDSVKYDIGRLLLKYLDTDTLLVFAPAKDCDGKLRPEQERIYRPIIKACETFLELPEPLTSLDSEFGLLGNSQSEEVREHVLKWIMGLDMWSLVALEKAVLSAKSFLVGVCLLDPQSKLRVHELANAADLETIIQTQHWGEVEDTHDVNHSDIRRNLGVASIVAYSHGAN